MANLEVIDVPSDFIRQRTDEWYEARLGRVTGGKVKLLFDYYAPTKKQLETGEPPREKATRLNYRRELVAERLTKQRADVEQWISQDMKWGVISEPAAVNLYQLRTGNIVDEAPFVLHPDSKVLAGTSPDGLVGEDGCIEVKCLRSANHLYNVIATGLVPDDYIDQINMHLWITGRKWCDFVAYDSRVPKGIEIFVQRVERDEQQIKRIESAVMGFLDECNKEFKGFWAMTKEGKSENTNTAN